MKITFRWYGEDDHVTLQKIRQIPCVSDITTAVYKPVGTVWEQDKIEKLKNACNQNGLSMEVIESIPVHEDIKLGRGRYKEYIENYKENIRRVSKAVSNVFAITLCLYLIGQDQIWNGKIPTAQHPWYIINLMLIKWTRQK